MSALLALVPWYYRWLAIVGAFLACFGYGFVKGVHFEGARFDAFKAGVDKIEAAQLAVQLERKRLSEALIQKKDADHAVEIKEVRDYWTAYADRVRLDAGRGEGKKPVRIASTICNDPARDQQLSGAITIARSELRDALAEYRAGLGGLFAACEVQAADLVDVQDWAAREQLLNASP